MQSFLTAASIAALASTLDLGPKEDITLAQVETELATEALAECGPCGGCYYSHCHCHDHCDCSDDSSVSESETTEEECDYSAEQCAEPNVCLAADTLYELWKVYAILNNDACLQPCQLYEMYKCS